MTHAAKHRPPTRRRVLAGRRRDYVLCGCGRPRSPSRVERFANRTLGVATYAFGVAFALLSTFALFAAPLHPPVQPHGVAVARFTVEDFVQMSPR